MIINHPYSVTRYRYWKDLNSEYVTTYEHIKKIRKLNKYKLPDYMAKHGLSPLDQYVASFNPTKRQFDFLKEVAFKKELECKKAFQKGIDLLLKAKGIIQKANLEIYSFIGFFLKSGIFSDEQIVKSDIKHGFLKSEQAFKNIWNIQVTENRYCVDMGDDPIYGKYARKYLKKAERIVYFQYNDFSFPESLAISNPVVE